MANKIFSIYSQDSEEAVSNNDTLIVEITDTHIACLAKCASRNTIAAFELFDISTGRVLPDSILTDIGPHSRLLNLDYAAVKVFIGNAPNVLMPESAFSSEKALVYLEAATGFSKHAVVRHDRVDGFGGIVNVYGIAQQTLNVIHRSLKRTSVNHTFSKIIALLANPAQPVDHLMKVQFYRQYFIVAVVASGELQLVQSIAYELPADVLYHLLNIVHRLSLNSNLVLEISGMIDLKSPLYTEILKYFGNLKVAQADEKLFHLDASEFPLHYFTPIFNLAQ